MAHLFRVPVRTLALMLLCIGAMVIPMKAVSSQSLICVGSTLRCELFESGDESAAPWIVPATPVFEPISASVGDTLVFRWSFEHNVELMASEERYAMPYNLQLKYFLNKVTAHTYLTITCTYICTNDKKFNMMISLCTHLCVAIIHATSVVP